MGKRVRGSMAGASFQSFLPVSQAGFVVYVLFVTRTDACGSTPAACTANPLELCYHDASCANGGVGCGADGDTLCRYCGFGHFKACPVPTATDDEEDDGGKY